MTSERLTAVRVPLLFGALVPILALRSIISEPGIDRTIPEAGAQVRIPFGSWSTGANGASQPSQQQDSDRGRQQLQLLLQVGQGSPLNISAVNVNGRRYFTALYDKANVGTHAHRHDRGAISDRVQYSR